MLMQFMLTAFAVRSGHLIRGVSTLDGHSFARSDGCLQKSLLLIVLWAGKRLLNNPIFVNYNVLLGTVDLRNDLALNCLLDIFRSFHVTLPQSTLLLYDYLEVLEQ